MEGPECSRFHFLFLGWSHPCSSPQRNPVHPPESSVSVAASEEPSLPIICNILEILLFLHDHSSRMIHVNRKQTNISQVAFISWVFLTHVTLLNPLLTLVS